jgi:hypothetical protein
MDFVHRFRARRQSSSASTINGANAMKLKQYFAKKSSHIAENSGDQMGRRVSDTESTTHFAKDDEGVQV